MLPYQQFQQGLVRNSSLWGGKIGGQKPVWTSLQPPPPNLTPQFSRTRVIPVTQLKECYHTNNPNRVWSETQASGVVRSGVKNRFGPHCTPSHFDPPNSREQELSRYTHLSDSIHWASLDIIKRVRPETQAHDLRDMLLLKSMYFCFFSVYSIGIPLFLENKSYPGIPTPRS